jgi:23S rRNA (uracil1939-C5)-methyltransferase
VNKTYTVGDVIEVFTDRMAYGGDAIARLDGMVIFIPLAAPGERLRVRIVERKKNFARGVIEEILDVSPARREPPCPYFGECGGCQFQHINYETQLKSKADFIRESLARIGRIEWNQPIEIQSASEFGYRSRAQIKLERAEKGSSLIRVGFNRAGSHSVCDVESCVVLEPELDRALSLLRSKIETDKKVKQALTSAGFPLEVEIAQGDSEIAFEPGLPGLPAAVLERKIGSYSYSFSPSTFFQINALMLEKMIDAALGDARGGLAIDLYAGVGLFTLPLSSRFNRVTGVEADRQAARFARENIRANDVSNVEFLNVRVEDWLRTATLQKDAEPPDLILLDPPRAGAQGAAQLIAELNSRRISYVSCDPTTLARDLKVLCDAGYRLTEVSGFDLFPQTYHVETIAMLER